MRSKGSVTRSITTQTRPRRTSIARRMDNASVTDPDAGAARRGSLSAMKLIEAAAATQSLFDAPSPAAITLYDSNGEAVVSPVWFRLHEDMFEVVMAIGDRKLAHLEHDPRCVLLIFETVPPFRGVLVRGRATLRADQGAEARLAIATRYLGAERARRYADVERRPPGVVVRLPVANARTWDLQRTMP